MFKSPCVTFVIFSLVPLLYAGQIIPVERTFGAAWQNSGYPGASTLPARIINVRDFGAFGTGHTNDYLPVLHAINSLSNQPGVVYFPAGTYLLHQTIKLPSGTVLRGDDPQHTTLVFDMLGSCIMATRTQTTNFQPVVAGYTVGSAQLVVSNSNEFAAGDYAEIHEDNVPEMHASTWARKTIGQFLHITAVTGNTLTLERPLRITYATALHPEIRKIVPVTDVGIENLRLERLAAGTSEQRHNLMTILFDYAARCWVRGVESANGFGGHIGVWHSTQISITGCYIHHAHDYGGGGAGYGVRLEYEAGECRVENNIFQHLRHSMLMQIGANGNVLGYNYSCEPTRTEFPSEVSADVVLHGNYPYANLIEGNICQHIWIDDSHGANGPLNTFFRNRAEAYGFTITDRAASNQNIVGNETFKGSYSMFLGGGYAPKGTGHFEYGNDTKSKGIQPPGTTNLTDISYYLSNDPGTPPAPPAFWKIADKLPIIGLPLSLDPPKANPAYARFLSKTNLTVDASSPPIVGREASDVSRR